MMFPYKRINFWWLFCGSYQYWAGWVYCYVVICPGAPEGSTGSGSGLKVPEDGAMD